MSNVLEAAGLTAGYGSLAAVRGLDFEVAEGEIVAVLGANGAGKTTALKALAGALPLMDGSIRWKGELTNAPLHRRARMGLGYVPEERSVFLDLTAAENLRVGDGPPARAVELFPELRAHLERRAGLLSGGQQQILTLGRALAHDPDVLLCDELSLGLAPLVVDRLLRALQDAAGRGVGVVLVEQHARKALAVADRAYVLRRGRVLLDGPAAEVLDRFAEVEQTYLADPPDLT